MTSVLRWSAAGSGLVGFLSSSGCATVDPRPDYRQVDQHVATALGTPVERREDAAAAQALIDARLAGGLTAAEALELCLINNPRIRAAYSLVGVARADVVQAGLFQNPAMSLSLRLPDGGGLSNLELGVAQNLAELWLIPVRQRAARGELQRETLEVARAIASTALDTRTAYFAARAADRELEIASDNRGLAQLLVDVALARQSAGVGSEIDVNLARTELMQTELALQSAGFVAFDARRRLSVLLGLHTSPDSLVLSDALPDPPGWALTEDNLIRAAQTSRLDLVAAAVVVEAANARVQQEKRSVVSDVELGVSFERAERGRRGDRPWLADTLWASAEAGALAAPSLRPREKLPTDTVLGPALSLELPIFDQNRAQIARAEYLRDFARANEDALLLEVMQETRSALRRVQTAWTLAADYRDKFLPLVQNNLELAREAYRGGKLSLLAVLEAQKSLLAARARYLEALRDGAVALTELERAVGLPIERLRVSGAPTAMPASQPSRAEVQR